jgi:drug/metabolite transporter (DMT)-like permease
VTAPGWRNWLILAVLGIIWGGAFLGVAVALEGFGPLWVAAARISIGAIALLALTFASGNGLPERRTPTGRRIWLHCFGFAIFTNALPFALLSWGQQFVTSGFAGITMAVVPLFVLPLAAIILHEVLTLQKLIGFLLGFIGVLILIGIDNLGGFDNLTENLARIACVGASLCYAIGTMITRTCPQTPLMSYSAAGLLIATAIIVPIAIWVEGVPSQITTRALLGVLFLGLFPTALATILLVRVINSAGPSFMSLVNYQVPIWAVINGMVFLNEAVPPTLLTALILILAGLAISQARSIRFRP